ncbi:hypothetical protein Mapa_010347 [Marchantia paleacea]|nr:hypothetical protein Mapa_010347 [Marchantia paleacea]
MHKWKLFTLASKKPLDPPDQLKPTLSQVRLDQLHFPFVCCLFEHVLSLQDIQRRVIHAN